MGQAGATTLPHRKATRTAGSEARLLTSVLAGTTSLAAISGSFNLLFKVLFNLPSQYFYAIGDPLIFSLMWNIPHT